MICIIAAVAANGVIGSNGSIPWDIPEDRQYFRDITQGGAVIMGRLTYESIGRLLPGRYNIVVSGSTDYTGRMLKTVSNLDEAIKAAETYIHRKREGHIFLCGGAEIYRQGLRYADKLYLTELYDEYEGDVYFPEFSRNEFNCVSCDVHNELKLRFCVYERIKK
ncbi:dihydrofolate reductase [Ruminococcus albus]|uniref:Dihydrofolate reductase n=1 Tax=Ruminococcus albus TaxID=1264 RepID=A0A1I1Q1P2_RUMAL|nr:dihydrofolate reductase [Ruminococcus albus]SFD16056.1 dihydrofolate reductase [Ruminococcus albus]